MAMNFKIVRNAVGQLVVVLTKKQAQHVDQLRTIFNVKQVTKNMVGQTMLILNESDNNRVEMIE